MEIHVPSLLRNKPNAFYKLGKYLRTSGFNEVSVFWGLGLKELLGNDLKISFESSEIKTSYEQIVESNDVDNIFAASKIQPSKTSAFVGIGGGKVLDFCKYLGTVSKKPVVCVPTILSNDSFCSPGVSLVVDGKRKSLRSQVPYGVIIDQAIICGSPRHFMISGIGDLFAKITAVFDWKLSYKNTREYVNDFAVEIVTNAVDNFVHFPNKSLDDMTYIGTIARSLLMCGMAMEIAGSSRPASGSEHLISHAYDLQAAKPTLHGVQVGVASYAVSFAQGKTHEAVKNIMLESGFFEFVKQNPLDLGDFLTAVKSANKVKENFYTVLSREGVLEQVCEFCRTDELAKQMLV